MKFAFGQDIRFMRFFGRSIRPQMTDRAVCAYPRYKAMFSLANAQKARFVSFLRFCLMLYIFGGSYIAQIMQSVIVTTAIYVVYVINRPSSVVVKPYETMRSISRAINSYHYIPLIVYGACARSYGNSSICFYFPDQIARFWDIVKNSNKFFIGDHVGLLTELSYANLFSQARMKAP
jgi:hypothetical protein